MKTMSALSHSKSAKSGQSAESGEAKSVKSAKSNGSKTSISVKIPSEQAVLRSPDLSVSRGPTPDYNRVASFPTATRSQQNGDVHKSLLPNTRTLSPNHNLSGAVYSPPKRSQSHPSSGTIPPQATPLQAHVNDEQIGRLQAAQIIERTWLSYRDKQMFRLLKHAVCAAEHSLSNEILRKVAPKEAYFLKDKALNIRMRFRFGGTEFPPMIYFKIYTHTGGKGINYMSGRKIIQPASSAARQACELMGNRKFYDQVLQDVLHHRANKITDEIDVTTLKDYMQYLSVLDETPAYLGGKENSWRKLTLEVLPRSVIFYDIVDFLYSHHLTPRLRQELPTLVKSPLTQGMQIAHIKIISDNRPLADVPNPEYIKHSTKSHLSSRRSKQARIRAIKMKKMYDEGKQVEEVARHQHIQFGEVAEVGEVAEPQQEQWEEEAERLYEWTQELSFDDLTTPRLVSTASYLAV